MKLMILAIILLILPSAAQNTSRSGKDARKPNPGEISSTLPRAASSDSVGKSAEPDAAQRLRIEQKFQRVQQELSGNRGSSADSSAQLKTAGSEETPGLLSLAFQVLCGLIFVLVLAVISIRLLKKLQKTSFLKPQGARGEIFEVMETCHLGPNHKVIALRVEDRICILGSSPQGINLLKDLETTAEEMAGKSPRHGGNTAVFSDSLDKLLERFKKPKKVSEYLKEV